MRTLIAGLLALGLVAGCGSEEDGQQTAPGAGGKADTTTGSVSGKSQAVTETEAKELEAVALAAATASKPSTYRLLGGDPDRGRVYLGPAVPAPDAQVVIILSAYVPHYACPARAEAVLTTDGWKTQSTAGSKLVKLAGEEYFVFSLKAPAEGQEMELAFHVDSCTGNNNYQVNYWLNNDKANYRFQGYPALPLEFLGNRAARQQGLPVEGQVFQGHALEVSAQTYPSASGTRLWLHYSVEGQGDQKVAMVFDRDHAGEYGNNLQWTGTVPIEKLPAGAKATYWISAVDAQGKTHWLSSSGNNFQVEVVDAPQTGWLGAGRFTFTKFAQYCKTRLYPGQDYYNWCYSSGLKDPFVANYSVYQAYGSFTHFGLEVFVPGVTDKAWPEAQARRIAEKFLRVEVASDLFSKQPGGAWSGQPMEYATRLGNNFVYAFKVYAGSGASYGIPDGVYGYKFRASCDGGATWTWLGTDAGGNRTLNWDFR